MPIIKAQLQHVDQLAQLFDQYREFYKQQPNIEQARVFIRARLENNDSEILLALNDQGEGQGFTQLYPAFASVAMRPMWILNDLFVTQAARGNGVATQLLLGAKALAEQSKATSIKLCTALDNDNARALYEKLGYLKISAFDHYQLKL